MPGTPDTRAIGQVQGLVIDPDSRQVTHVLLQEGHLWGRKEVAIPIRAVTVVDDGIRLNLTKQQVQDLPPAGIHHPNGESGARAPRCRPALWPARRICAGPSSATQELGR